MRIAFIGQKTIPVTTGAGGVERFVEEVATRFVRDGHQVMVYTRRHYSERPQRLYKGVQLIALPAPKSKNFEMIVHTTLAALDLLRRKVDIVFFPHIGTALVAPLVRILKPRAKIIVAYHSRDEFHEKWGWFARKMIVLAPQIGLRSAHAAFSGTKLIQKHAAQTYGVETAQIYNSVSAVAPRAPKLITSQFGLQGNDYFLVLTRLIPHKGVDQVIRAFKQVETDKKLVIVGGGSFTDSYVQELQALSSEDPRILMVGAQFGTTLWELLSNAYAYVHASKAEGLPFTLLEAMAYGRATILSNIPEHREAANDLGFYFPVGDSAALAQTLRYALAHPEEVASVGAALQERANTVFSWEKNFAAIEQLVQASYAGLPTAVGFPLGIPSK